MRISIVFHSVCGNTYLMAKKMYKCFRENNVDVQLLRVEDSNLEEFAQMFPACFEYADEMKKVPIASAADLLDSDYIFLGSPTYFGNVTAKMKTFMDSFCDFWLDASFYGKKLVAFSSCSTSEGGGEMCLQAINIFGQHMGMTPMPIPSNLIPGESMPAYGFIHYSGAMGDKRPGDKVHKAVENMVGLVLERDN